MTTTSDDDEKLDFETIRLKFLTTKSTNDLSNNDKGTEDRRPARNLPPLLPKSKRVNNASESCDTDLQLNISASIENEQLCVKEAIRRFNNIGPRLFEQSGVASSRHINQRSKRSTSSLACASDSSLSTGLANNVTQNSEHDAKESESSVYSTDTETVNESHTLPQSPDFNYESLNGNEGFRKSSLIKDETLHKTILNEMKSNGLFKLSSDRVRDINELFEDIGKMRETSYKTSRPPCVSEPSHFSDVEHRSLPHPRKNTANDDGGVEAGITLGTARANSEVFMRAQSSSFTNRNTLSVGSSQSASTYFDYPERDAELYALYNTGDEKEDKRLRDLHSIAKEFFGMQDTYVNLLNHIGESYPKFIHEYSKRSGKPLLSGSACSSDKPHVIIRVSDHFKQILGVHRMFLDEFAEKYKKWDSRSPDMASVLQQKAEFLKICNSFLKEKRQLCEEMQQALDENKDLALATKRFEDSVLNCDDASESSGSVMSLHGISIVMQLDSVHQNIVRYRLLMERYQKYLPADHPETHVAKEALRKLTVVSNTVNGFLAGADATQRLMPLYRKLGGVFDVFAPGRQLIHEGELQRQTRKELQLRYLLLFSDMLLICRYPSMGTDSFDLTRLYKIPIERVCVQAEDHEDYEREFVIISPKKTSAFVAKTKRDRDIWMSRIADARRDYCEKKRKRRLLALQKTASSQQNSCEDSPELEVKAFQPTPVKEAPVVNAHVGSTTSTRNSQRYEALWIPDNKATKCLMMGCDTKFNVLRRKHHCRQCGWLICRNCVGYAPVKIKRYERVKVCPECYYEIKQQFEEGKLFPPSRIQHVSVDSFLSTSSHQICEVAAAVSSQDQNVEKYFEVCDVENGNEVGRQILSVDDPSLRIIYDGGLKYETPKDLFQPPSNGSLRKTMIPVQKHSEMYLASGKVLLRNRKGMDVLRWGRLTKEMFLQFFEAEFDDQPLESYFVYGYFMKTVDLDTGGCVIELIHRNQFQTDRKEERVIFQVNCPLNETKVLDHALRWLSSLRECIGAYSDKNPVYDD